MKKREVLDPLQMLLKWGLLFLVFSWVIFVLTAENGSGYGLLKDETKLLEGPWTVTYEGKTLEDVTLPTNLSVPKGRPYTMKTTLPSRGEDGYLLFRVPMQRLEVRLNGEVHYKHPFESSNTERKPLASLWVLVPLTEEAGGQTLELTFDSDIEAFSGLIIPFDMDKKVICSFTSSKAKVWASSLQGCFLWRDSWWFYSPCFSRPWKTRDFNIWACCLSSPACGFFQNPGCCNFS